MKVARLPLAAGLLAASIAGVIVYHVCREKPAKPYAQLMKYYDAHEYGTTNAAAAFAEVDRQLTLHPDDQELISRKIHLAIDNEPLVAVAECRRILQKDPHNQFALSHCSVAYIEAGDLDKALYYAALNYQQKETPDAHNIIGQIFYRRHDCVHALAQFNQALKLNPADQTAIESIAVVKRNMEQH